MRALLFLAVCLHCAPASPQNTPSLRPIGQLPRNCTSIQFASAKVGKCLTTEGLYRTADGGRTWVRIQVPPPDKYDIQHFQFLDAMRGWIWTISSLYWTNDDGRGWLAVRLPVVGELGFVKDAWFAAPNTGWILAMREIPGDPSQEPIRYRVAGEHSVYVPALFRTDDGGRTWKQERYPDLKGLPHGLEFADSEHGLSIELNETLFTRDGGKTWRRSRYCADVNTKHLRAAELGTGTFDATTAQLLDAEYGWWSVEGDLFRTTDGGATWCRLPLLRWRGRILKVHNLRFANREVGWAVPSILGHWDDPAPCFQTLDGGKSWTAIASPPGTRIEGLSLAKDGTAYFWGDDRLFELIR